MAAGTEKSLDLLVPNTLIHIAVQAPLSRKVFGKRYLPWILFGTIIPDIPWIFQRIVTTFNLADPYFIRLYATAQASLFFCLFLCLALCFWDERPGKTFLLLATNSLFHLFLDALQIKWGNGVHLFAPISWDALSLGFFWPETAGAYLLTFSGALYLLFQFPSIKRQRCGLQLPSRWMFTAAAITLYFTGPIFFLSQVEKSDPSFANTLRQYDQRSGKDIEADRAHYSNSSGKITFFTGEAISVEGSVPEHSTTVSIKGKFVSTDKILATSHHVHNSFRDTASKIGVASICLIWLYLLLTTINRKSPLRRNS